MILNKALVRFPYVTVLVAIAFFHCTGLSRTEESKAAEVHNFYDRQPVSLEEHQSPAEAKPEKASIPKALDDTGASALWQSYIWAGLPMESLSGPEPDSVSKAYLKNEWKPIFIDSQFRLNQGATLVLARLKHIEDDAIDPVPFKLDELAKSLEKLDQCRSSVRAADPEFKDTRAETISGGSPSDSAASSETQEQSGGPSNTPQSRKTNSDELQKRYQEAFQAAAEADIRLTTAFLLFSKEMNPFSQQEQMKAISGEIPISVFLKELEPTTFNYRALVSTYAKYRKLAATRAAQRVSPPAKGHPGESGNYIRELQKRLQQEDFYSGNVTGVYDQETERAVKAFQSSHMIDPDGVIGQRTKEWLNISFQEKAEMVAQAIRTIRKSPLREHSRFIRINIPQFQLEYYNDGQLRESHRIVVGKASGKKIKFRGRMVGENQTPTIYSAIEQVILNPRWYVNDRIRLELDSQAKSDPEWFSRHGYVSMRSQYASGQPRIFQSPGPKNALGRVKFEFPNPYAVYLHDTPLKHLFQRTRRDFSHGCIRLDKALGLAETILKDDGSAYASKMEKILAGSTQTFVKLSKPVPISIEYIPVVTNSSGQVIFLGDPYGILKENDNHKG